MLFENLFPAEQLLAFGGVCELHLSNYKLEYCGLPNPKMPFTLGTVIFYLKTPTMPLETSFLNFKLIIVVCLFKVP
ncbi:hypothetical protein T03_15059 [Trichinella britovi]|uniref:Uncharacterized protein n=1 Tax=Trichinella britovi TaxID=45882 RepID=A0A0V1DFK6_TRIBR|nr:hypothetical protein T03_15059 [Trichinella britovi]